MLFRNKQKVKELTNKVNLLQEIIGIQKKTIETEALSKYKNLKNISKGDVLWYFTGKNIVRCMIASYKKDHNGNICDIYVFPIKQNIFTQFEFEFDRRTFIPINIKEVFSSISVFVQPTQLYFSPNDIIKRLISVDFDFEKLVDSEKEAVERIYKINKNSLTLKTDTYEQYVKIVNEFRKNVKELLNRK